MRTVDPHELAAIPGHAAVLDMDDVALFLDLDGTLAPLCQTPGEVGPDAGRNRLLGELTRRLDGRTAIVSGRTVEEVDRIVEGTVTAVAGIHGLQRRAADGALTTARPHPRLDVARGALEAMAGARRGLAFEDKQLSVALHYRGAPGAAEAVRELAQRVAKATGLALQEGHMVVELRTPGPNKGDAVAAFMAEAPFAGARPIYIGDDLTDEDAFAAVAAAGGYGVLVGPERRTFASWRLDSVGDVLDWLGAGLDARPHPALEGSR
ncbi:MAG TPA: trehalose-phosphatase [Caulobacteraceae bacterium]|nr:trehalose-phosphatase [Caulobacteraceae bacterium]